MLEENRPSPPPFNLETAIAIWRRQVGVGGIDAESLQELEAHLCEDVERSMSAGIDERRAFEQAVCGLGDAEALRNEFRKERTINYRRLVLGGLALGSGMLGLSLALCHFIVIPAALAASEAYARWLGFRPLRWDAGENLRFVVRCTAGVALGSQIPVVLLTLVRMRFLNYRFLVRSRKYAIVINLVLSVVCTGPEVITLLLLFLPLQALYELCVWTTRRWEGRSTHSHATE